MPESWRIPTVASLTDGKSSSSATHDEPLPPLFPLNRDAGGLRGDHQGLTANAEVNQRLREMGFGEEQRVKVITLQKQRPCQGVMPVLGSARSWRRPSWWSKSTRGRWREKLVIGPWLRVAVHRLLDPGFGTLKT